MIKISIKANFHPTTIYTIISHNLRFVYLVHVLFDLDYTWVYSATKPDELVHRAVILTAVPWWTGHPGGYQDNSVQYAENEGKFLI